MNIHTVTQSFISIFSKHIVSPLMIKTDTACKLPLTSKNGISILPFMKRNILSGKIK